MFETFDLKHNTQFKHVKLWHSHPLAILTVSLLFTVSAFAQELPTPTPLTQIPLTTETSPPVISPTKNFNRGQEKSPDRIDKTKESEHGTPQSPKNPNLEEDPAGHSRIIKGILKRLSEKDPQSKVEAAVALSEVANVSDLPLLSETLKKGNNLEMQLAIIDALGKIGDRHAAQALRFEGENGTSETKRAAVVALGKLHDNWPIPYLVQVLENRQNDIELRKRAAAALGNIDSPKSFYALQSIHIGSEPPPGVKRAVFWALAKMKGQFRDQEVNTSIPPASPVTLNYRGTSYHFYNPAYRSTYLTNKGIKPFLMVCVHDLDLNTQSLFQYCVNMAKERGIALLVPFFDPMRFPEYETFNIRGERADLRLLELIKHVTKLADLSTREIYFFGIGVGADFVQRFALAYPQRIARAVIVNNHLFLSPDKTQYYPIGVKNTPFAPDLDFHLDGFAKSDIYILLPQHDPHMEFYQEIRFIAEANEMINRLEFGQSINEISSTLKEHKTDIARFLFRNQVSQQKVEKTPP